MVQDNLETFQEIIKKINAQNYYQEENKKLRKEINNIKMGRPRKEGIYDNVTSRVVPERQKEKEIALLEKRVNDNKKSADQLLTIISQIKSSSKELEDLAEKDVLLDNLFSLTIGHGLKDKPSVLQQNHQQIYKVYSKSKHKIRESKHKISKKMYNLIKRIKQKKVYKLEASNTYISMDRALDKNKMSVSDKDTPARKIFLDVSKEYKSEYPYPFYDKLSRLGVDIEKVTNIQASMNSDIIDVNSLTSEGKHALNNLNNIKMLETVTIGKNRDYTKLMEIKEEYSQIIDLSRITRYIEEVLNAFKNTKIKNCELYIGLQDLAKQQNNQLSNMITKTDKIYDKLKVESKLSLIHNLEELYLKIKNLENQINQLKQKGDYKHADLLEEQLLELRYEMIKILRDNPELNNDKYGIDVQKLIEQEKKLYTPEVIEMVTISKETKDIEEQPVNQNNSQINTVDQQIVEEKNIHATDDTIIEESIGAKEHSFEPDSNLQHHRTFHYQNYMREKVLNSDLGKLSFSSYLEAVAPHLTELIKIEKQRESLANTIYKQYIQYYADLQDKKESISFYQFAQINHGIDNIDIPVEKEEEYEGMRKK